MDTGRLAEEWSEDESHDWQGGFRAFFKGYWEALAMGVIIIRASDARLGLLIVCVGATS